MAKITVDDIMKKDPCWSRENVEEAFGRRKSASLKAIFNYLMDKERPWDAYWVAVKFCNYKEFMVIHRIVESTYPKHERVSISYARSYSDYPYCVFHSAEYLGFQKSIHDALKPVFARYA